MWIIEGQGPTVHAESTDIVFLSPPMALLFFFAVSLRDGSI